MAKQTIRDIDPSGRKVIVRVDFNVPQDSQGAIKDDRRTRAALPTLRYLLDGGASLILLSHLGRPKGKDPKEDAAFRMDPIARRLQELIGRPVKKVDDITGPQARKACEALAPGEIVLLENVRFDKRETKGPSGEKDVGDPAFAAELASLGDLYVNDAFGTCHRDHASMKALPECFPPEARAIGFLVEKELATLDALLGDSKRPLVAIMGGAKVSDKILVIENLLRMVDHLLIGGAMSYTFLKAQGHSIGNSLCETDQLDVAKRLLAMGAQKIVLPSDHLIATAPEASAEAKVIEGSEIPDGWLGVDIGPRTIKIYSDLIRRAATVVWNGPVGKFEDEPFSRGTKGIADALAECTGITAVGGGETAEAVEQFGVAEKVTHVSTGGGAFLECLEGKSFNSLAAIPERS